MGGLTNLLGWKWDLIDCFDAARQQLRDAVPKLEKCWDELALEEFCGPIPSALRQSLEDIKKNKEPWLANLTPISHPL